jgi:hypothetical protein
MHWSTGKWETGKTVPLQWKKRAMVQKFPFQETLSFPGIWKDLLSSQDLKIGVLYRNWAQCRYSRVLQLLEAFTCDCTSNDGGSDCFSNFHISFSSGFQVVCPGQNAVLVVPPTTIIFPSDSINDPETTGCVNVEVDSISPQPFEQPQEQSPSSYLISQKKNSDLFSFLNSYQAAIGQIAGEGIQFKFSSTFPNSTSSSPKLRHLELCVSISDETGTIEFRKYPIRDLAITGNDLQELVPKELTLVLAENGLYCTVVEDPIEGKTYYPVVRIEDWVDEVPYTTAEIGMMYFAGAVYSLVAFIAIGLLVDILLILKISVKRTLVQIDIFLVCLSKYFFCLFSLASSLFFLSFVLPRFFSL